MSDELLIIWIYIFMQNFNPFFYFFLNLKGYQLDNLLLVVHYLAQHILISLLVEPFDKIDAINIEVRYTSWIKLIIYLKVPPFYLLVFIDQ